VKAYVKIQDQNNEWLDFNWGIIRVSGIIATRHIALIHLQRLLLKLEYNDTIYLFKLTLSIRKKHILAKDFYIY